MKKVYSCKFIGGSWWGSSSSSLLTWYFYMCLHCLLLLTIKSGPFAILQIIQSNTWEKKQTIYLFNRSKKSVDKLPNIEVPAALVTLFWICLGMFFAITLPCSSNYPAIRGTFQAHAFVDTCPMPWSSYCPAVSPDGVKEVFVVSSVTFALWKTRKKRNMAR